MFDTVNVRSVTEVREVTLNVHEHRAPTDDSVKLLMEMRDKAYDSIIETLQMGDNNVKARAIMYRDHLEFCTRVRYQVTLNGEVLEGEEKVDIRDETHSGKYQIMRVIYERIAKHLAAQMVSKLASETTY